MKNLSIVFAGSILLLFLPGCQQARDPSQEVGHGSTSGQSAEQKTSAAPAGEATTSGQNQADADKPDDPGMTTDRDKTVKQEQPSGDESSQAAPNEGDAEPPK